jgi:oligoribonuclease
MVDFEEKAIVWVDVETNGLDAHKNYLLEVAALVTDLDLNILDEVGYQTPIHYTEAQAADIRSVTTPYVQNMHDQTGLWGRLPSGKNEFVVDAELLAYIKQFVPEPRTARLGGNSVRLDLNFLEENLPFTAAHLHYRMFDVTSLAGASQWWGGVPNFEKRHTHSAMDDIQESIAEARYIREHIRWV